jgi:hypothetical protein
MSMSDVGYRIADIEVGVDAHLCLYYCTNNYHKGYLNPLTVQSV